MAEAKTTTDHKKIQQWAEKRGGKPACVRGTGGKGDTGLLRIDFPGYSGADSLQEIEWDEFFEKFEEQNLALVYQEKTAGGKPSNFNKLVSREGNSGRGSAGGGKKKAAAKRSGTASAARKKSAGKSAKGKTATAAARKTSGGKKAAKKAPKKAAGAKKKAATKSAGRKKAAR